MRPARQRKSALYTQLCRNPVNGLTILATILLNVLRANCAWKPRRIKQDVAWILFV
jgi:hypothetical protein